jgi:hypothetical protein
MAIKNTRVTRILCLCSSMLIWLLEFSLRKEMEMRKKMVLRKKKSIQGI